MDDAVSETIVPSGHSVHQNAKAIAKVEQMLLRRTPSGSRKLKRENRKPKVPFRGDATRDSQTPETGGQKAEFRD